MTFMHTDGLRGAQRQHNLFWNSAHSLNAAVEDKWRVAIWLPGDYPESLSRGVSCSDDLVALGWYQKGKKFGKALHPLADLAEILSVVDPKSEVMLAHALWLPELQLLKEHLGYQPEVSESQIDDGCDLGLLYFPGRKEALLLRLLRDTWFVASLDLGMQQIARLLNDETICIECDPPVTARTSHWADEEKVGRVFGVDVQRRMLGPSALVVKTRKTREVR